MVGGREAFLSPLIFRLTHGLHPYPPPAPHSPPPPYPSPFFHLPPLHPLRSTTASIPLMYLTLSLFFTEGTCLSPPLAPPTHPYPFLILSHRFFSDVFPVPRPPSPSPVPRPPPHPYLAALFSVRNSLDNVPPLKARLQDLSLSLLPLVRARSDSRNLAEAEGRGSAPGLATSEILGAGLADVVMHEVGRGGGRLIRSGWPTFPLGLLT